MHIYVTAAHRQGHDREDGLLVRLYMPSLAAFLQADREAAREAFDGTFKALFKRRVRVRFEDECERCWSIKDVADGQVNYHCPNPQCSNGFPPREALGDLMKRYRYLPGESASAWAARLTDLWRKESSK